MSFEIMCLFCFDSPANAKLGPINKADTERGTRNGSFEEKTATPLLIKLLSSKLFTNILSKAQLSVIKDILVKNFFEIPTWK